MAASSGFREVQRRTPLYVNLVFSLLSPFFHSSFSLFVLFVFVFVFVAASQSKELRNGARQPGQKVLPGQVQQAVTPNGGGGLEKLKKYQIKSVSVVNTPFY